MMSTFNQVALYQHEEKMALQIPRFCSTRALLTPKPAPGDTSCSAARGYCSKAATQSLRFTKTSASLCTVYARRGARWKG